MAARFVAAIDHGTSSTRCILFEENTKMALSSEYVWAGQGSNLRPWD
jgi:glycerol kinase